MSEAPADPSALVRAMLVAIYRDRGAFEGFRSWTGPQPYADQGFEPHAIARRIGYPAAFGADAFVELDADEAAALARFFVGGDMVYATRRPVSASTAGDIERAISALGPEARYVSNARWHRPPPPHPVVVDGWAASSMAMRPLSKAAFDGGLIGFNGHAAFIFWVEQED